MLIEACDELHLSEDGFQWIALAARTFDVSSDMRNERPVIEPSDCFE
jgi:hypothetical protein